MHRTLLGLLSVSIFFITHPALASTSFSGTLTEDTTWTLAQSPIILPEPLTIPQGITLTIEPGVIVKMGQPSCNCYANIWVNGTLIAGSPSSIDRVLFTSMYDDTGGDDDGTDTPPSPGDWRMISVGDGATLSLLHTDVRYGGRAELPYVYFNPRNVRMIHNFTGTVDMDDVDLSFAYQNAAYAQYYLGTTTITNSHIHDTPIGIEIDTAGLATVSHTRFSTTSVGLWVNGGNLTVSSSTLTGNGTALLVTEGSATVTASTISGNSSGVLNQSVGTVSARGNWWGTSTGPTHASNPSGTGDRVSDRVDYGNFRTVDPLLPVEPSCVTNCNSNVLFLPGVAGSRLYQVSELESQRCLTDTGDSYFKRWLPLTDCDNEKLKLDTTGVSQNHIVTKDVVDEAAGIPNIYASFLSDLKKWKNDEKIIADYSVIPYDWRLSVDDILNKGKKNAEGYIDYTQDVPSNETPYIMSELLHMASSSRTGKVTIVTHSNGGLIAKALMLQLRALDKEDLVDKIIFVAVPEIGTPDAVGTLLHGSSIGPMGIISDKRQTRDLSQNMSTAYNLLPSEKYYQTTAATIPIATFDNLGLYPGERAHYGQAIGNFNELTKYLLGVEGRNVPDYSDLNTAAKANSGLLALATVLHTSLDSWTPASTTKVIEVAGVGEYTMAGLQYLSETYCVTSHDETSLFSGTQRICDEYAQKKILKDVKSVNGDATVVADSAHYLSNKNTSNIEQWWVNLAQYNPNGIHRRQIVRREHKDIFEVPDVRNFIRNQMTDSTSTFDYMSSVRPVIRKSAIKYDLHSPLSLNLFDDEGRHTGISTTTGLIEENIPGTRYVEVGDTKEIIADAEITQHLLLQGYASGSFSLGVEKLDGDTIVASTTYSAVPSSTSTIVTLDLPPNADLAVQAAISPLKIDFNGDGTVDAQMVAKSNQETVYDVTPPAVELSFDTMKQSLEVTGYDLLSSTTVATTSTSIKVTDRARNSTELLLTKYKVKPKKIELVISGIKQNGVLVSTFTTPLTYKWNILSTGTSMSIKTLASYTKTQASSVETHYRPKKGLTAIMTTPFDLDDNDDDDEMDLRAMKEKLQGMHVIKLRFLNGKSIVSY